MAGLTISALDTIRSVELLLGARRGQPRPRTTLDWVETIRRGIPANAVESLRKAVGLSQADFARVLGIPERTLARRRREGMLNSEESAKLLRLARVVGRAYEVFENPGAALHWLKTANAALAGSTPLSLLDTDVGGESILDTLGRIEHGVFA